MNRRGLLARYLHYPVIIAVTVAAAGLVAGALVRQLSYRQTVESLAESARLAQVLILDTDLAEADRLCKRLGGLPLQLERQAPDVLPGSPGRAAPG